MLYWIDVLTSRLVDMGEIVQVLPAQDDFCYCDLYF